MKKEAALRAAWAIAAGIVKKFPTLFHKGNRYGRNVTPDQLDQHAWNKWHKGVSPRGNPAGPPPSTPFKVPKDIDWEPWRGWRRPTGRIMRHGAYGVGGTYLPSAYLLSNSAKGGTLRPGGPNEFLPDAADDEPTTSSSPLSVTESALVGGTVGGLGSLLYGTLKDQPSLRRDLIATLIGGASGGAYNLLTQGLGSKKPLDQTEGVPVKEPESSALDKDAAVPPWVGAAGRGLLRFAGGPWTLAGYLGGELGIKGYDVYQTHKGDRRSKDLDRKLQQYYVDKQVERQAEQKKHDEEALEAFKNKTTAMDNLTISQKAQRFGAGGALAGGALGALLSSAYGKGTDRERMRRDIISMLGGAAIGGTAGVMYGDQRLIPDWARSAADKVRSTADKVRSSVSDRLSPKV